MKKIGVIDIGSNSIRLVLLRIGENNSFKIIDELKETVRLGEDMDENLNLSSERMEKAIKTLKFFKDICNSTEVHEIIAVATEAVRKANNKDVFLGLAKDAAALDIRILSGEEEAYYDYLGVIHSMDIKDTLIMDIGGCSAELILVKDKKIYKSISLPFGAINITEKFRIYDDITPEKEEEIHEFFYDIFRSIPWMSEIEFLSLVGVGGTIRNIAKIDKKLKNYPLAITHNYEMTSDDVLNIYNLVKSKNLEEKKKIRGLSKERADIFSGACSAVCSLIKFCAIDKLLVSGNGLREGLIYEYITKHGSSIEDVLDFSINNLLLNHSMNNKHGENTYRIVKKLFIELSDIIDIDENVEKILKTSSMLHDCGIAVNYYTHNLHSQYLIINSPLYGLSHRELLMSAYITAFHHKDDYKLNDLNYENIITKDDIKTIRKLALLLNIAEAISKSVGIYLANIACHIEKDTVVINVVSTLNYKFSTPDISKICSSFKKIFKKDLVIV
ncbi:exopolyphosphatase [Clostridium sp. DJ247]|uniref:exopolyphosphatase n=1 Tax=Clostridium sp. DJ247 TaxID=2726188 RepID=UPI0016254756|nr:exopolyphosphatase [Clostridium sp. DJ247]MBC2582862.1 exopolyphosphatase [Clostridium sp. DJ247]